MELTKLTDSFLCLLSQTRWTREHKAIWLSLRKYHDENGGLTPKQVNLLAEMYAKYQK